jgi:periplasmic protein CpxP/Spy
MKSRTPKTLARLFTASLLVGGSAPVAALPVPPQASVQPCGQPRGDHAQRLEEHLSALRAALQLTPDQASAWTAWSSQFNGDGTHAKHKQREFAAWSQLPVLERMASKLAFTQERVRKLEARLVATRAFYATLSTNQRQLFDTQFHPWPAPKSAADLNTPVEQE